MSRCLKIIGFTMFALFLVGCMPRQTFEYSPPVGKQPLACISQCKVAYNSCMTICALKNSTCRKEKQYNASLRYSEYTQSRHAQGLPVKKTLDDFIRTTSCEHSCNCVPAYNTCYRACGGKVYG